MTNPFEGKTAEHIANKIYNAKTAKQVDASFKALESIDPAIRAAAIDKLEKKSLADLKDAADEYDIMGPMGADNSLEEMFGTSKEEIAQQNKEDLTAVQSVAQIFNHVAAAKGQQAAPQTKAIATNVASLTDKEKNDLSTLHIAVMEAFRHPENAAQATKEARKELKKMTGGGFGRAADFLGDFF